MRMSDWSSDVCSSDLLGAGAGEPLSAEGLHAHHRADLVAVDVDVADLGARGDVVDGLVDARVDAQGQAVAGGVDGVDYPRSEERRGGKECVSMCRSRWSPYH